MLGFFTILEDVIYAMLMYVWSTTGIFLSPHMSKEKSGKRIHFLQLNVIILKLKFT